MQLTFGLTARNPHKYLKTKEVCDGESGVRCIAMYDSVIA
jgi:hypothetical protein